MGVELPGPEARRPGLEPRIRLESQERDLGLEGGTKGPKESLKPEGEVRERLGACDQGAEPECPGRGQYPRPGAGLEGEGGARERDQPTNPTRARVWSCGCSG